MQLSYTKIHIKTAN